MLGLAVLLTVKDVGISRAKIISNLKQACLQNIISFVLCICIVLSSLFAKIFYSGLILDCPLFIFFHLVQSGVTIFAKIMSTRRANVNIAKPNLVNRERRSPKRTKTPSSNELKNKYSK